MNVNYHYTQDDIKIITEEELWDSYMRGVHSNMLLQIRDSVNEKSVMERKAFEYGWDHPSIEERLSKEQLLEEVIKLIWN